MLEASISYLRAVQSVSEREEVPSLSALMYEIAQSHPGVTAAAPAADGPATFDVYWVHMIVSNLVANALQHGVAPVTLAWNRDGGRISIEVRDAGHDYLGPSPDGAKALRRGHKGLGVGLSLVHEVAHHIGAALAFAPHPSRFTLTFAAEPAR